MKYFICVLLLLFVVYMLVSWNMEQSHPGGFEHYIPLYIDRNQRCNSGLVGAENQLIG